MNKLKAFFEKIFHKKDKRFVSGLDKFITAFDEKHPQKSLSQQAEIKKYKRIIYLRDNVDKRQKESKIWESF